MCVLVCVTTVGNQKLWRLLVAGYISQQDKQPLFTDCVCERESECVAHCLFASVCMKILVSN